MVFRSKTVSIPFTLIIYNQNYYVFIIIDINNNAELLKCIYINVVHNNKKARAIFIAL